MCACQPYYETLNPILRLLGPISGLWWQTSNRHLCLCTSIRDACVRQMKRLSSPRLIDAEELFWTELARDGEEASKANGNRGRR